MLAMVLINAYYIIEIYALSRTHLVQFTKNLTYIGNLVLMTTFEIGVTY